MKFCEFLATKKTGFHLAKITPDDVRSEDVLELIGTVVKDIPVFYIPDHFDKYRGMAAVAYNLYSYLDKDFFTRLNGLFGTVFQSLLPEEDIPGEHDVYPGIDENVTFYVLLHAMDYIAKKIHAEKIIWVFGRIDFSRDYMYRRFIYFLRDYNYKGVVIHLGVVPDATAKDMDLPEIDDFDVVPKHRLNDMLLLPFTDDHKLLLGVLSIVADIDSGHITVSFIERLTKRYMWGRKVFQDLLQWHVIEHYSSFMYSFTNLAMKDFALENFADERAENIVLSLMERRISGNMLIVAYLSKKRGDIRRALGAISFYGRWVTQTRNIRLAYDVVYPFYKEYREHLSKPQMLFFLKVASARADYDRELVDYIVKKVLGFKRLSPYSYFYLALCIEPSDRYLDFWRDVLERAKQMPPSRDRNLILLSVFHYLWHSEFIMKRDVEDIEKLLVDAEYYDDYLRVHIYREIVRIKLLMELYEDAHRLSSSAIKIIEDHGYWFLAPVIFNNMFVALARGDFDYPNVMIVSILFKAYYTTILYRDEMAVVAFYHYLIAIASTNRSFTYIKDVFVDFVDLLSFLFGEKVFISLNYAMSIVSCDYGYYDLSMEYITEMERILDLIGWDNISYGVKRNYYYSKAYVLLHQGKIEGSLEVLKEWKENIGIYGDSEYMISTLYFYIDVYMGRKKPTDNSPPYCIYNFYVKTGNIKEGIDHLRRVSNYFVRTGNMLYLAQAQEYLGYLHGKLGSYTSMERFLGDALAIYHILDAGYYNRILDKIKIPLMDMPKEFVYMYVSRMMLTYMFADIFLSSTIKDAMMKILSSLAVPATGSWILFRWEDKTTFVGLDISSGITYKYERFFVTPDDIDDNATEKISDSPSYVYVTALEGESRLVIYAENRYMEKAFSDSDIFTLRLYASYSIRLLNKIELGEKAMIDSLTGVFSRWYIEKLLEKEIEEHLQSGKPLSVLFVDVDDFKKVNDMYGHDVGDRVLSLIVKILKDSVRMTDMVGRYGGDEFIIVLPSTDAESSVQIAERIRANVNKHVDQGFSITVSIGVCTWAGDDILSSKDIIRRADRAMYMAKRLGKNRVFFYRDPE